MSAASPMAPAKSQTAPQHLRALARANRVRLARAALKRAVGSGERSATRSILECPWECESMSVSELLSSQRRWGRTRSRKFLVGLALSENKRIGTLTPRQRMLLASALRDKSGDGSETVEQPIGFSGAPVAAQAAGFERRAWSGAARGVFAPPSRSSLFRSPELEARAARAAAEGPGQPPGREPEGDHARDQRRKDRRPVGHGEEDRRDDCDRRQPRDQQRVGAVAGEVLAERDSSPASEPSASPVPIRIGPRGGETKKPSKSKTSAMRTTISESGNDPHGGGGASSLPARRFCVARRASSAATAAGSGGAGAGGRFLRRRFFAIRRARRSPCG